MRDLVALAHERRVPVLIHAGRGIPALGQHTVALSGEFPDAKLILAHGAISDLAWLWQVMPEHPNLFVDTAWWNPADLMALFCLAPPAQILWASDSPYGLPVMSAVVALRCALQAGLWRRTPCARSRAARWSGCSRASPAPTPGRRRGVVRPLDPHLERVVTHLVTRDGPRVRAHRPGGADRARAARVRRRRPTRSARRCARPCSTCSTSTRSTSATPPTDGRPFPPAGRFVVTALAVARTPDVALPELPDAPPPTRAEAERAPGA